MLRIAIIIISVFLSLLFWGKMNTQAKEISNLRERSNLVAQIPDLEARLKLEAGKRARGVLENIDLSQFGGDNFVLSGIFIHGDDAYALINLKDYRKGDPIEGFDLSIYEIDPVSVTLLEKNTDRKIKLILYP